MRVAACSHTHTHTHIHTHTTHTHTCAHTHTGTAFSSEKSGCMIFLQTSVLCTAHLSCDVKKTELLVEMLLLSRRSVVCAWLCALGCVPSPVVRANASHSPHPPRAVQSRRLARNSVGVARTHSVVSHPRTLTHSLATSRRSDTRFADNPRPRLTFEAEQKGVCHKRHKGHPQAPRHFRELTQRHPSAVQRWSAALSIFSPTPIPSSRLPSLLG
jgi:hypothetical protein